MNTYGIVEIPTQLYIKMVFLILWPEQLTPEKTQITIDAVRAFSREKYDKDKVAELYQLSQRASTKAERDEAFAKWKVEKEKLDRMYPVIEDHFFRNK